MDSSVGEGGVPPNLVIYKTTETKKQHSLSNPSANISEEEGKGGSRGGVIQYLLLAPLANSLILFISVEVFSFISES